MSVNADFHGDFMINYGMLLPPMLADDIRIMIYVGMQARLLISFVKTSFHTVLPCGDQERWLLSLVETGYLTLARRPPCHNPSSSGVDAPALRQPGRGHAPG